MDDQRPDDVSLAEFLQKNAPRVPKASPKLEDQIFSAIKRDSLKSAESKVNWTMSRKAVSAVIAIAAAVIGFIVFDLIERRTNDADRLEQFAEESWDGAFAHDQDVEFQYLSAEVDKPR